MCILKYLFKIKYNLIDRNNRYLNEIDFYNNKRNGVYCKINVNRINLSDKYLFDYAVKLFNNLPKHIRCSENYKIFVKFINDYCN